MDNRITFMASLPDIQSAINISGTGSGARIKLDVPETDIPNVALLMLLRGKLLKVTIEDAEGETEIKTTLRTSAKRRV